VELSILVAAVLGLIATGCGSGGSERSGPSESTTKGAKVTGSIEVSEAASLTKAFEQIGTGFASANPDVTVTFNPGSSGTLAIQIQQTNGTGIDTFASADEDSMTKLVTANLTDGTPQVFAKNKLIIVTKPGNPRHVRTLADLAHLNTVSLCALTAPCGQYAAEILTAAAVTVPESKVTRGIDATATLAAVTRGDADAAIVYVTDARGAGHAIARVPIPDAENVIATYPVATLAASDNKDTARAFIDYVLSTRGQATLESFGFLPPT
jgi:molybdate transport system substrate-binding protein